MGKSEANFAGNVTLANVALVVNLVFMVVTLVFIWITFFVVRKQEHLTKAAAAFPVALETVTYSEIPIAVVAVIADHMQIPLGDVIAEDAEHRRSIVLKAFRKDRVTDNFIRKFFSKFIRNGYIGEDLLAGGGDQ